MSRFKKPAAYLGVAALSAAGALTGNSLLKDTQLARAREGVEAARAQLASADAGEMSGVFRTVGKVMDPSVVHIEVVKGAKTGRQALPFDDETLRRFFDRDGDGEPELPEGFGDGTGPDDMPRRQQGTGSGVIMEVQGGGGFILTNNHVAGGATELRVTLSDGRVIKNGKVVGTDPKTDLAVIKVEEPRLIPAKWGDSDSLQRGDYVMAFGSPFGYVGSMTHGIVSALNRQAGILERQQGYESFIQVDCPINPGNSGGPLTNLKGEVVGVNTAIASRTGSFSGIGFAIPSNQAKYVFEQLKGQGRVVRGWIGVGIADVARESEEAKALGYKGEKGVLVRQTFANTPATGKLQAGDVITELDGKPVETVQALREKVAATAPNTDLKMKVFRDGGFRDVTLKIGEQPDDLMAVAGRPAEPGRRDPAAGPARDPGQRAAATLGLRLADPSELGARSARPRGGDDAAAGDGPVVTMVQPTSPAARAGLQAGDVLTRVNDAAVKSAREATDALGKADLKQGVRLYVSSGAGSRLVFVRPGGED